jgi:hypothetical protein
MPLASQSMAEFSTAQSGNNMIESLLQRKLVFLRPNAVRRSPLF